MNKLTLTEDLILNLCKAGFQAFVVGGAVRDVFAGLPSSDEDIVTNAKPDQISEIFIGREINFVGKSFGVTIVDGVEIATFRTDRYNDIGNKPKDCIVDFADSIEEDLARRDLTINSIAACWVTGDVVDPFNGKEDLKNKIVRFVGNPAERIHEDPNRIIRAARFLAKLEGEFDPVTLEALKNHRFLVRDHVAKERIRLEILKALELPKPSIFFKALQEIGVLEFIFPEMVETIGHDHGKHHREDVFTHLLIAGDNISPKFPLLRLAGFLHDVGKPKSFTEDGKFIGHENVGASIVKDRLAALRFSLEEIEVVSNFVAVHMLPIGHLEAKGFRRLFAKLVERNVKFEDFLRLRVADRVGNLGKANLTFRDVRDILTKFRKAVNGEETFTVKNLAINGQDIMEVTGLKEGPEIGKIKKILFEFVVSNGFEFNDRVILLRKLKKFVG